MKRDALASEQEAPRHPIAVVAERTGLSPDLLRIWERRYRAVEPTRRADGHRAYSDDDIARLRLLHAATAAGRSIRQVAGLSTQELSRIAAEDMAARRERAAGPGPERGDPSASPSAVVEQALASTATLQSSELEHLLRRSAARFGLTEFIEEIAVPLLRRIGDQWHAGESTIAQEHLASSLVHDILSESMRSMVRASGSEAIVIATPTGERHSIGAALIGASAAADGWRVVYLGADLPADEIAGAALATGARVVALSLIYVQDLDRTLDEVKALRARLPASVAVVVGGAGATLLSPRLVDPGIHVGTSLSDLRTVLDETMSVGTR